MIVGHGFPEFKDNVHIRIKSLGTDGLKICCRQERHPVRPGNESRAGVHESVEERAGAGLRRKGGAGAWQPPGYGGRSCSHGYAWAGSWFVGLGED